MEIGKSFRQFSSLLLSSGIYIVAIGFSVVAIIDLTTILLGTNDVLILLNSHLFGILLSSFVFDSWGTVLGLLGVILLFSPVLLGTLASFKSPLAIFFVLDSVAVGIISSVIWNEYFNPNGEIPYGASSIAISAQAIIFTMSAIGLVQLWARDNWIAPRDSYWRKSLAVIYATLVATTLWFVLILEPIFVPSNEYNWRVHQIGFFLAVISSLVFFVVARLQFKSNARALRSAKIRTVNAQN